MAKTWKKTKRPLVNIISCGFYVADVVTDILLAISFYGNGDMWYFSLTLTFILLSTIVSNIYSLWWSWNELDKAKKPWIILLHCCSLGMFYRYALAIRHGKSIVSVGFMGIIEIILESGPQLILQLYILIANTQIINPEFQTNDYVGISKRNSTVLVGDDDFLQKLTSTTMIFQAASIVTSLLSIALVCTKINNLRLWKGDICYFIWHVFSTGARIVALSLFSSVYTFWTPVIVVCRCIILGVGYYYMSKRVLKSFSLHIFLRILTVLVNIFSYVEFIHDIPKATPIIYFIYDLIENSTLVCLWCWVIDSASSNFLYLALSVYGSCECFGILFMVIYLKYVSNYEEHLIKHLAKKHVDKYFDKD